MNLDKLQSNLTRRGFTCRYFATAQEAADYLTDAIRGKTVGIGGSITVEQMGLYDRLSEHNDVSWHWRAPFPEAMEKSARAQVYLSSVNGLAETGEIINIDGVGNRIAATLYGRETVYFLVGKNKIAENYDKALYRARNIAAPLNARRLNRQTPCALKDDMKCYDCKSPDRICNGLTVLWHALSGVQETQVILIDEDLGY